MSPRSARRAALLLVTGAAVFGPAAAGRLATADDDTGERYTSPAGRVWRVIRDPETGDKHFEDDRGATLETVADIVADEFSRLGPLERAVSPELLARLETATSDDTAVVILVFRRQPASEAADLAMERHGARMEALAAQVRASTGVDAASEISARDELRTVIRDARREVLDAARAGAAADQAPVVARLEGIAGVSVLARSFLLSTVTARIPVRAIPQIVAECPGVSRIEPCRTRTVGLDVSVPVTGAGTWWSAGYTGSSSTKIAVLDTGIDASHPAFSGGIVSNQAVYLAVGSQDPSFADNASSVDDNHFHGTHVGGIVASNDSTYRGMAYGARLMGAKCGYATSGGGGNLQDADILSAGDWAADNGADVFNCSFGGSGTTNGSDPLTLFMDGIVHDLGISIAVAAGNAGSSSGTILIPGDGFNVVTVGNFSDAGTTSTSDDGLTASSSRGPCSDGRRKPDLCAPGTNISSCYAFWESSNPDFVSATGTSMASPHVAGALALIIDSGVAAHPQAVKALLVGNASTASPVSGAPNNNWGCGTLSLSTVYANRAGLYEGTLTSSGARYQLLRAPSLASGKRVSLVWNRRVLSNNSSAPTTYSSLLDLDLYTFDESGGASRGTSVTSLNSVEQVALSAATSSPIVKVYRAASSFPSGLTSQAYAVAAEATTGFTAVNPPSLSASFATLTSQVAGTTDFTVAVNVSNSGGCTAQAPSVALTLPTGYSVVSGSNPQSISGVAASGTGTATWTVRSASSSSGTKSFSASAASSSYGESFTSNTANASQTLDVDAPSGSVTAALDVTTSRTVSLTLSASDALTGVTQMRLRDSADSWGSWVTYATSASVTLADSDGTRTVEAQFRDAVGNVSSTATDTVILDRAAPSGSLQIAGGAAWVAGASVTLSPSATDAASGVADMRFSDDGTNWSAWTTYATSAAWTLPGADGTKTVYAQFRDVAGNVASAVSSSVGLDRLVPSGTIGVADGAAWTTTASATLTLSASDATAGVADMRFSDNGTDWSSWTTYATSAAWTLPGGDGSKTVYAQFRDAAGNVSSAVFDAVGLDRSAPSASIDVASGASWTTTTSVTLTLLSSDATSGVSDMRLSDDGTNWSSWTAYATSSAWTLPGGDGSKTVYAQFRDVAGNVSSAASDALGLDRSAPTGTISVAAGADWTTSTSVTLTLSATDATSGVAEMRLSDDGTNWSSWTTYATSSAWTLPSGDGAKTVYAQFRDAAGLVSTTASDSVGLDGAAPSGSISIAAGAAWTTSTSVTLTLSASDATSGVVEMRLSDDGTNWSSWTAYATSSAWTLPGSDGTKTVYAQFRDAAGLVSSAVSDAAGLDRSLPTGSISVAGGAAWATTADVALTLAASDSTSGVADMRFSDDGETWSAWTAYGTTAAWTLPGADGSKVVYAQYRDVAGNVSSSASDAVGLDTAAPAGSIVLERGAAATNTELVEVGLDVTDPTSGIAAARFSDDGTTWTAWAPTALTTYRSLPAGEGVRSQFAQFRDVAGNVSEPVSDAILVDRTAPVGVITLRGDAAVAGAGAYLAPGSALVADFSTSDGGSGVADFRFSHDGGSSWSPWSAAGATADLGLPPGVSDARHVVLAQFRDAAGNVSVPMSSAIHLLAAAPQDATLAETISASFAAGGDVDAFRLELQTGDRLDARFAAARGAAETILADLYAPDGARVVSGRYPEGAKRAGIAGFVAGTTGSYVLVLRTTSSPDSALAYRLTTTLRPAKATPVTGTDAAIVEIPFDAAAGRLVSGTFTGSLAGTGVVEGPSGSQPVMLRLKKGKFVLAPVALGGGSGPHVLRLDAAATLDAASFRWTLRVGAPKRAKRATEI